MEGRGAWVTGKMAAMLDFGNGGKKSILAYKGIRYASFLPLRSPFCSNVMIQSNVRSVETADSQKYAQIE